MVYMRCLRHFVVLAATVSLIVPATAGAATPASGCVNRPDVAALDQYCPALPGADGRGLDRGPLFASVLPDKLVKRLEETGAVGQGLLALTLAAPEAALAHKSRGRGLDADELLKRGSIGGGQDRASANPIKVAARTVTESELGMAFGSVLLMSAFGIAGASWRRFRRRTAY